MNLAIYLTVHYPDPDTFFAILDVLEANDVRYLELGIPSENPNLDGEVVKETHRQVITDINDGTIIEVLERIRERYSFQVVLMTYADGICRYHLDQIPRELYVGILCVDTELNPDDYTGLIHIYNHEMTDKEIDPLLKESAVFNYIISGGGKTGSFAVLPDDYKSILHYIKANSSLPAFVGFGIKNAEDVHSVMESGADGAIIGSEFIQQYNTGGIAGISNYLQQFHKL